MVSSLTDDDSHEAALAAQAKHEEGYVKEFAPRFTGEVETLHHAATDRHSNWAAFIRADQQPEGARPRGGDEVHHAGR